MSKEQILHAIRSCARKLKRNPSLRDLRLIAGISEQVLYKRFGSLRKALEYAGLRPAGPGIGQKESTLLLDWSAVARKLGKLPSVHEYESAGRFSNMPFHTRYRRWTRIPDAFRRFAAQNKIESRWKDVIKMIAAQDRKGAKPGATSASRLQPRIGRGRIIRGRIIIEDRPLYGPPLLLPELAYEPLNEQGVIFAFGVLARRLGFTGLRFQTVFPDCEAMRVVAGGRLQRVFIEFEIESRNFAKHRHKPNGCDMIVCWCHNWPDCPLEVLELKSVVKGLMEES